MTIYCFLAAWSFCTVAGSAWAINIPFNFSNVQQCQDDDFQHSVLPEAPCLNAYYFSLFLFGVIVITLSLLDLKEQVLVQMFLGLLRFITVGAIIVYCVVRLIEGGDKCLVDSAFNLTVQPNYSNLTQVISIKDIVLKFDPVGWLTAIPVFTYAFILHQGIPSLTHPIKQKQHLRWLTVAMFVTAGICYFSLGLVVPLWFKADIQETCTLNWVSITISIGISIYCYTYSSLYDYCRYQGFIQDFWLGGGGRVESCGGKSLFPLSPLPPPLYETLGIIYIMSHLSLYAQLLNSRKENRITVSTHP